jgi:hypothetical protein
MSPEREEREGVLPDLGVVDPPPCRPPLEIVEQGTEWVLEKYRSGSRDGETFGTFDGRLDAMQAAQDKMEADVYPCIVRWDAENVVGGLYWNEDFKLLEVRYGPLLDAWAIVPECGHFLFQAGDQFDEVVEYAQAVQREYDFKELALYSVEGEEQQTVDHRFLRHSLAESGVRFDSDRMATHDGEPQAVEQTTVGGEESTPGGGSAESSSGPVNSLMTVVKGFKQLDVDEETKTLLYYDITWTNGQPARVAALKPDLADEQLEETFLTVLDHWETISDEDRVATVLGHGDSPSRWIAYDPGQAPLATLVDELGAETRLDVIGDVAEALDTANRNNVPPAGVAPGSIRVGPTDGMVQATLAEWGLRRTLLQVAGETPVTWYTAPEQLQGTTAATTGIYQLAAIAYWLLLDTVPFVGTTSLQSAIEDGSYRTPSEVKNVPEAVDDVLGRAMAPQPYNRYNRAIDFHDELRESIESE